MNSALRQDLSASIFNVHAKHPDGIVVYNTYTTSMALFSQDEYNRIFVDHEYTLEEVKELIEYGFFIESDYDEVFHQIAIRRSVRWAGYGEIRAAFIAPTLDCNAHCYYCYEHGVIKERMDDDTANATESFLFDHKPEDNRMFINWFGGEPTLEIDRILEISRFLIDNGIDLECGIITNGYNLNPTNMKKLEPINLTRIQITIDAVGVVYDSIKKINLSGESAFERVIQNIRNILNTTDIHVAVRVNYNPSDLSNAYKVFDYFEQNFEPCPRLTVYPAELTIEGSKRASIADKIDLRKRSLSSPIFLPNEDLENEMVSYNLLEPVSSLCYATKLSAVAIDPSGTLYKCHRLLGRKEHSVGHVSTGFRLNNEYKAWMDDSLPYERCYSCVMLPCCHGGCRYRFLIMNSEPCKDPYGFIEEMVINAYNGIKMTGGESR